VKRIRLRRGTDCDWGQSNSDLINQHCRLEETEATIKSTSTGNSQPAQKRIEQFPGLVCGPANIALSPQAKWPASDRAYDVG
jgi:hypothetical protein